MKQKLTQEDGKGVQLRKSETIEVAWDGEQRGIQYSYFQKELREYRVARQCLKI